MKTRGSFKIIYFLFILFSASTSGFAQTCIPASTAAGALDNCFDGDGRLTTQVTGGTDIGRAVLVRADGSILVAGTDNADGTAPEPTDFVALRYKRTGAFDITFGSSGMLGIDFDGRDDEANALAVQPDGRIVLAGFSTGSTTDFAVARLTIFGRLDDTFGTGGKVLIPDIDAGSNEYAKALLILADGKILVIGDRRIGTAASSAFVVRLNANGSLDTTFDDDGRLVFSAMNYVNAAVLQADGKILLGGNSGNKLTVGRLNADGSTDTNFGTGGVAGFTAVNRYDEAYALAIEPNGKILAAGLSQVSTFGPVCAPLVRFSASGTLENNSVNCNESPGGMTINALTLQPDGKIISAGYGGLFPSQAFQVIRYNTNFSIDSTFNGTGMVRVKFSDGNNQESMNAYGVAMQRDNRIVAVGATKENSSATDGKVAVARIHSGLAAPRDTLFDFDGDGKADVSVYRPSEKRWYVFRSSDAGIIERFHGADGNPPVPADYDGDGKTDFAVIQGGGGDWRYLSTLDNFELRGTHWGGGGNDIYRPSDFDGDGKADYVLYRSDQRIWFRQNSYGEVLNTTFGLNSDKAVTGDFDGDGKADPAIYRPSTGDWWWKSSINNGQFATHWGISTDTPVAADYDGDGKTDFAVYRASDGTWYIYNSATNSPTIINFGLAEDKPVAADYDGDGKADIAVFRPSTGVWYLLRSTAGFAAMQFGISSDVPLPNVYVP